MAVLQPMPARGLAPKKNTMPGSNYPTPKSPMPQKSLRKSNVMPAPNAPDKYRKSSPLAPVPNKISNTPSNVPNLKKKMAQKML